MGAIATGFYNASAPESSGGAGLGMLAYYALIGWVCRVCGAHHRRRGSVVSLWGFGPSAVLAEVTERAPQAHGAIGLTHEIGLFKGDVEL